MPLDPGRRVAEIFEAGRAAYGDRAWSTEIVRPLEDRLGIELRAPGFRSALDG